MDTLECYIQQQLAQYPYWHNMARYEYWDRRRSWCWRKTPWGSCIWPGQWYWRVMVEETVWRSDGRASSASWAYAYLNDEEYVLCKLATGLT